MTAFNYSDWLGTSWLTISVSDWWRTSWLDINSDLGPVEWTIVLSLLVTKTQFKHSCLFFLRYLHFILFFLCNEYILFVNQHDIKLENLKESPAKVHLAIESLLRGDVSNHKRWNRYFLSLSVHFWHLLDTTTVQTRDWEQIGQISASVLICTFKTNSMNRVEISSIFNWTTSTFCRVTNSFCSQLCCDGVCVYTLWHKIDLDGSRLLPAQHVQDQQKETSMNVRNLISQDLKNLLSMHWLLWIWFLLLVDCFWRRQADVGSAELQTKMAAVRRSTTTSRFLEEKQLRCCKIRKQTWLSSCFRWCDQFQNGWWKWGEAVDDGAGGGADDDGGHQGCFHRQEAQDAQVPRLLLFILVFSSDRSSFQYQF